MYLPNKYTKWYNNIISNAQSRVTVGYTENHHIIPKSLGGTNDKDNLVELTAREHFICHLLLIKMVTGGSKAKMAYSAMQQSRPSKYKNVKISSRIYALVRSEMSKAYAGIPKSEETKRKLSMAMKGRPGTPHTNEHKLYMSNKLRGIPKSEETKRKLSMAHLGRKNPTQKCKGKDNPMYGRNQSESAKKAISSKQSGIPKPKFICPHCNKVIGGRANFERYHNSNCKLLNT